MTSPSNTAWARDAVDKVLSEFLSYDGSLRLSEAGIANLRTDLVSAFLAAERRAKEECARIAQGDKAGHADCGHDEGYWDGRTDAAIAIRSTHQPARRSDQRMSADIPMTDFSALEREGRSDVERSALRRAGEFYRVIIDMQAAELTALRQRVADMTRALERQTQVLNAASVLKSVGGRFDDPLQVRAWTMLGKALDDYYALASSDSK